MKLVDFKCLKCNKVYEDLILDEKIKYFCKCGNVLTRIYGYRKNPEFIPDFYHNFEHKPIFIESRKQFKEECVKRDLERVY